MKNFIVAFVTIILFMLVFVSPVGADANVSNEQVCHTGPYGITICDDTGIEFIEEAVTDPVVITLSSASFVLGLTFLLNGKALKRATEK